nr:Gag-Pol polyprotein [Tanacetum cinerariifolium]
MVSKFNCVSWQVVQICLWCVDSGCSKHMTGNIKLLINFVWMFLGTVHFRNDHITAILGYGDLNGELLPSPGFISLKEEHLLHQRSGWVHFLRTKDEIPEVIKNFLKKIYVHLQAPVIIVRTDNGTEFKNHVLKVYFDSVGITNETSAAKLLSKMELLNAEITPYELIQGRKPDISHLHVFGALCYPKNDREDIGKLGTKGDIGFFIGYSANYVAYRVYNQRTRKIMETMNVTFDKLSAMAFEQNSSRPGLQKAPRVIPAAPVLQNLQASTASMSFQDSAPVPTNSLNTPVSSHNADVTSQQHAQQQRNLTLLPTASVVDNVSNAGFKGELFVNPFGTPSTESVISYTQYDSGFELTGFSDADYAGCKDTFKSTSGGAQFLGEKLVSWSSKKQDCTSLSTA